MDYIFDANYHTHTFRCHHAVGTAGDYADKAESLGIKTLGISDHTPLPDNWWAGIRMDIAELPDYSAEIDSAKNSHPDMAILKSAECDYYKHYDSFFKDELLGKYKFDYLIGSIHSFMYNGEPLNAYKVPTPIESSYFSAYTRQFIDAMESGLFAFMAHPDLIGMKIPKWTPDADKYSREMMEAAKALHMPFELNVSGNMKIDRFGFLPFPREEFWSLVSEYGIEVIINTDTHNPEYLNACVDEGFRLVKKFGLKLKNILK